MYKCFTCETPFYSLVDCEKHLEAHHPDDDSVTCSQVVYRCSHCGVTFGHWSDVKNHSLRDHGLQRVDIAEVAA